MPGLAAFAKASAAEWAIGPAKPWRRRDPGIHQSSRNDFVKIMDCRVIGERKRRRSSNGYARQ
jgi:hypothetical protein